jgi:hypothetical protein
MEVHQKKISVTDLICEANRIWEKYGSIKVNAEDPEAVQKAMDRVLEAHPDFAQVHMIIVRYIVQMKLYSPIAVKKYGHHVLAHPWKTLEDMIEAQVYYVKNLYKHAMSLKTAQVNAIGDEVRAVLLDDAAKYKRLGEELMARQKEEEEAAAERMRRETRQYFEQHGTDACNIPIRAVTKDVPTAAQDDLLAALDQFNLRTGDLSPPRSTCRKRANDLLA